MKEVQYVNPEGLNKNPVFSNVVVVPKNMKTVFIGGQNSVNAQGKVISKGNLKKQTKKALKNIEIALKAVGAKFENIIKWNIYIVEGNDPIPAFEVSQKILTTIENPPAITVIFVSSLAHPDFLIEIDAIAVIPE